MDFAELEQSHWKSPGPSPSRPTVDDQRRPRGSQDSSSLQNEHFATSELINSGKTNMEDDVNYHRRPKGSHNSVKKGDIASVKNTHSSQVPRRASGGREEHKRRMGPPVRENASIGSSRSSSQEKSLSAEEGVADDEETGLTKPERGRRRRRKRRHTLLDERIAGDVKSTKEERKVADMNVLKSSIVNVLLIALWFVSIHGASKRA